mgnify:CR=1 FL=1
MNKFRNNIRQSLLENAKKLCVFSDFDGTLVEFAERPEEVYVSPELTSTLKILNDRAVMILVTGRSISSVQERLSIPGFRISGCHGVEHSDGSVAEMALTSKESVNITHQQLEELLISYPGVWIEKKPYSFAVHYRSFTGNAGDMRRDIQCVITTLNAPLFICDGTCVFEVCINGCNKGAAIDYWLSGSPASDTIPVFVGDDVTDEFGFQAINSRGGVSIRIGFSSTSSANYYFTGISEYLDFLEAVACSITF